MAYEGPHPFPVKSGGTGASTFGAGTTVVLANGTSPFTGQDPLSIANGGTATSTTPTNGQTLIGNGTNYTVSTLTGGSSTLGALAQIAIISGPGTTSVALAREVVIPTQPCFLYYLPVGNDLAGVGGSTTTLGDGSPAANVLHPQVDQNNNVTGGIFEAPIGGNYLLGMQLNYLVTGNVATFTVAHLDITNITSGATYTHNFCPASESSGAGFSTGTNHSITIPLALNDQVTFSVTINGSSTITILSSDNSFNPPACSTFIYGMLLC